MSVDIRRRQAFRKHQDLQVIEKLGDLFGRLGVRLVLGSHPHLGGLFDDLLTNGVHAGIELRHRTRLGRPGLGYQLEFLEQIVERLHKVNIIN